MNFTECCNMVVDRFKRNEAWNKLINKALNIYSLGLGNNIRLMKTMP